MSGGFLRAPGLAAAGIPHGFGRRGAEAPTGARFAVHLHGAAVARIDPRRPDAALGRADAVLTTRPGMPAAVRTADCVPVLLAAEGGGAAAAVHAGWRGLAAGVVEAGVAALREAAAGDVLRAAVGPRIGPCCYEVDAPVWHALGARYGAAVEAALTPSRPAHVRLDLAALVRRARAAAGLAAGRIEILEDVCTCCDPVRFESARRDGPRSGRLVHWIAPSFAPPGRAAARLDTPQGGA